MDSIIMAIAFNGLSCDVHEDCDGTCSDGPHYAGVPLLQGLATDIVLDASARRVSSSKSCCGSRCSTRFSLVRKARIFLNSSTPPAASILIQGQFSDFESVCLDSADSV